MSEKKFKTIFYWLSIAVIGILFGFSLQFVKAWSEPTATAPNGNVSAPINIGVLSQYKTGALGIGGLIRGYSDVMGNRLCIGSDCRSAWPASGITNGLSAGQSYTSINNDSGNSWPDYADQSGYSNSTYGGSNFSNWPDYADQSGYSSSTYGGSNFSVWPSYAYSAGNSDMVDGYHASGLRMACQSYSYPRVGGFYIADQMYYAGWMMNIPSGQRYCEEQGYGYAFTSDITWNDTWHVYGWLMSAWRQGTHNNAWIIASLKCCN